MTPISDLIVVDNGGAYAATPMTVSVPVTIPDGTFAMGFYLLDDGSLEPMPLVDESPTTATVMTRHFSSFFIAAITDAALTAAVGDGIGTGFHPGEDDFQTPNYGSYLAPGGHCGGQALAMMWYFEERRSKGALQLWGLHDANGRGGTLGLWEDDSNVYRLASTVHEDYSWGSWSLQIPGLPPEGQG